MCQTTAYDTEAPSLYNASDTMNFASKCCTAGNLDIKLGTCPIDIDLYLLQVNRVPVTVTALPRPNTHCQIVPRSAEIAEPSFPVSA